MGLKLIHVGKRGLDVSAPGVVRSSATVVLTMQGKLISSMGKTSSRRKTSVTTMLRNDRKLKCIIMFPEINSACQRLMIHIIHMIHMIFQWPPRGQTAGSLWRYSAQGQRPVYLSGSEICPGAAADDDVWGPGRSSVCCEVLCGWGGRRGHVCCRTDGHHPRCQGHGTGEDIVVAPYRREDMNPTITKKPTDYRVISLFLNSSPLVPHICVSELGHHWFR